MSHPEGWNIALERIAAEKGARTGYLDLGELGLTELPQTLFELQHLESLNLGRGWRNTPSGEWQLATGYLEPNTLGPELADLHRLPRLIHLSLSEAQIHTLAPLAGLPQLQSLDCSETEVSDLAPLAGLSQLQSLSCSYTEVSNLALLAGLPQLQSLSCSNTKVSNLAPLAGLSQLQRLQCSFTNVSDLAPLAGLSQLQSLNCSGTSVSDLAPLAGLSELQSLSCSNTKVSNLTPLAGLPQLQSLDCRNTQVSDLAPLAGLTQLQSLDCSNTNVSDLAPLAALLRLQSLTCWRTQVSDLAPLAGLTQLQSLDCSITNVSDLAPLAKLPQLQRLNCTSTRVSDLAPLAGLPQLQSLDCSHTQLSDLAPLAGLPQLRSLYCSYTSVSDLAPLAGLPQLRSLECSETQVSDLAPLAGLLTLQLLSFTDTPIHSIPEWLVRLPNLKLLFISGEKIRNTPPEVLSRERYDNCLDRLRAYFDDLAQGSEPLTDVKLIVIGNGQIGKTQICRSLAGQPFDPAVRTTHGIVVRTVDGWPLDGVPGRAGETARLHLWDFGGQDLYHGTHTLFLKSNAIFLVVWASRSEDEETHTVEGMTFRNHRLPYWIQNVRHAAGTTQPLLVVQNQCEQPGQEVKPLPPVEQGLLAQFAMHEVLQYSAQTGRKRATLDDAIRQAIDHEWTRHGQYQIPRGRLRVLREIEQLQQHNPHGEHRVLKRDQFEEICERERDISNSAALLHYLNESGVLMHRPGLFGDTVILDHAWALEAVYAVFERGKSFQFLKQAGGRFSRTDLEYLVWRDHTEDEQNLFLSWMVSCGICFEYQRGDRERDIEPEYIAPELLPDAAEPVVADRLREVWEQAGAERQATFDLEYLQPGLIAGLIARGGGRLGENALYWKQGLSFYDATTRSRARLDAELDETEGRWSGRLQVRTRGGNALELLGTLTDWLTQELRQIFRGDAGWTLTSADLTRGGADRRRAAEPGGVRDREGGVNRPAGHDTPGQAVADRVARETPAAALELVRADQPPVEHRGYGVSYSWATQESQDLAKRLWDEAQRRQVDLKWDTQQNQHFDSFERFVQELTDPKRRLLVILSDGYLKSENCMRELHEVWRKCTFDRETFMDRIRVFRLDDAKIIGLKGQLAIQKYWKDEYEACGAKIKDLGPEFVKQEQVASYHQIGDFARNAGQMLAAICDRFFPGSFEEFLEKGFDE
jgi:internalin A